MLAESKIFTMSDTVQYFDYELPAERIAQRPAGTGAERVRSRLLVATSAGGALNICDDRFANIGKHLSAGDLLILNNTKVLPWRFFGRNERDGRDVELLLVDSTSDQSWHALARPMKHIKSGDLLNLGAGLIAEVLPMSGNERIALRFVQGDLVEGEVHSGVMPIPPYIRKGRGDDEDRECYQTVYADHPGSIAAPTAGLHFTKELLEELKHRAIDHSFITLHMGPASFQPVRKSSSSLAKELEAHAMPVERYSIPAGLWQKIAAVKARGGKIIAVGTSSARALESAALAGECDLLHCNKFGSGFNRDKSENGEFATTELFIRPGFKFQVVDRLITNFHQPRSTHLLLVAALAGEESISKIYEHAC